MPLQQTLLLSPTELAYLHTSLSLSPPLRPDARSPKTFRPLIAETDLLPSANGSARMCFADGMEGIVGVKAELERTKTIQQSRDLGGGASHGGLADVEVTAGSAGGVAARRTEIESAWVEVTLDMPGQRDDDSVVVFLTQLIHESLVADGTLPNQLFINQRWHWKLSIDILLLSTPVSYPLPLLSLTTHLALLSTYLPALISRGEEDPLFNDDWDAALPLYPAAGGKHKESAPYFPTKPPVTLLVASVGSNIFFDPSREELAVADSLVAVTLMSTTDSGLKILAIRTIDPPSRLSISSSLALGGEPGFELAPEEMERTWIPRRGGMKRAILRETVKYCVQPGAVVEDVLVGLEAFG